MAIQLYKKGTDHQVDGVNFNIVECRSDSLKQHLKKGCVMDFHELAKPKKEAPKAVKTSDQAPKKD